MDAERRKDMKHKHAEVIKEWLNGEKVYARMNTYPSVIADFEVTQLSHFDIDNHSFYIKKEPVIEVKYFVRDYSLRKLTFIEKEVDFEPWDLRITYQDGVAIKAEVAE